MTDNHNPRLDWPSASTLAALAQDSRERCGYCDTGVGEAQAYCSAWCKQMHLLVLDHAVEDELLYLAAGYELDELEP